MQLSARACASLVPCFGEYFSTEAIDALLPLCLDPVGEGKGGLADPVGEGKGGLVDPVGEGKGGLVDSVCKDLYSQGAFVPM